jgi:hypothetical protein
MNKILQRKVPPAVFVLLALALFFGSQFFFFVERTPLTWLALFGCTLFFVAKIGQAFTSGKERINDVFSIFSKVGWLTFMGTLILKAIVIIKQQFVEVAGQPVQGTGAIVQGIFLIIFGLVLSFYGLKHIK